MHACVRVRVRACVRACVHGLFITIDPIAEQSRATEQYRLLRMEFEISPSIASIAAGIVQATFLWCYLSIALLWRILCIMLWRPITCCLVVVAVWSLERCLQDDPTYQEWPAEN
jgi:hypothetical protein